MDRELQQLNRRRSKEGATRVLRDRNWPKGRGMWVSRVQSFPHGSTVADVIEVVIEEVDQEVGVGTLILNFLEKCVLVVMKWVIGKESAHR